MSILINSGLSVFLLEGKFIRTIASRIKTMPIHWLKITFSPNKIKAMVTETGSSSEDTILPNPNPVLGNPRLNKVGGIMVPNNARMNP